MFDWWGVACGVWLVIVGLFGLVFFWFRFRFRVACFTFTLGFDLRLRLWFCWLLYCDGLYLALGILLLLYSFVVVCFDFSLPELVACCLVLYV